ncbi:hypothetical protein HF086_011186 [Spodoptera exigua]|uniref:Uncharacterized protein n=1 Tax=Spodoptera exigua TaxID=7107 RepID=A0A922MTR6_SPOEX|nr:hypothetical protein HF086_011186 [Spodoptera exigua]
MFWSFIKSNKKGPNYLPSSMAFEGRSCVTGEEICDAFAMYFQSNFLVTSGLSAYTSLRNASHISPAQSISDIEINTETVLKLLKSLDLNKGAGPDDIPPTFIVRCNRFHLLPLKERRMISDVFLSEDIRIIDIRRFLVKLAQSHIDSPNLLSNIGLRVPKRSVRIPSLNLNVPHCSTNYRQNSYFIRAVKYFNTLTDYSELDLFATKPQVFTRTLSKHWFDVVQ